MSFARDAVCPAALGRLGLVKIAVVAGEGEEGIVRYVMIRKEETGKEEKKKGRGCENCDDKGRRRRKKDKRRGRK